MGAFIYGVILQWKLDLRNKGILLTYYIVPLVFFGFMGGIFTSITPETKETLIQSMSIFGITMGAIIGGPIPILENYQSQMKKSFLVGGIPMSVPVINNVISAFIHLFIMSLIIFFVSPMAFGVVVPKNLFIYFLILAIFIITSLSIAVTLGLTIKTTSKLTMISQFIFLPSLMLSGIMFPVKMLPKPLEFLGQLFPAKWGFESLQKSNIEITLLIPLFIIAFICVCISIWRMNMLKAE